MEYVSLLLFFPTYLFTFLQYFLAIVPQFTTQEGILYLPAKEKKKGGGYMEWDKES